MTDLPIPVANYFAASNAHAPDAIARAFAEDARVHDEAKDHVGRAEISAWAGKTMAAYKPFMDIRTAARRADGVEVVAGVSGTFPGSPIELRYAFTVSGDEITALEITPV